MDCNVLAMYKATGRIPEHALADLTDEFSDAGLLLYRCYQQQPDIEFARSLLTELSTRYVDAYTHGGPATTKGLRLAGYLIGLHREVNDALVLWRTKQLTFDTASEFDIQLVAFAGVEQTIAYLQGIPDHDAAVAVDYLQKCQTAGDFDNLEEYFSPDNLPYWV